MHFDCVIVGGGIAGLQAAIQLGRYQHRVAVVDSNYGRSTLCKCYHNVLGWPDGVSGDELRQKGRLQAERLGVHFYQDTVIEAHRGIDEFKMVGNSGEIYVGAHVLLSTGILDRLPTIAGLEGCLGISVYVCPDCDGYEVRDKRTVIMGSGDVGAKMAMTLSYWSTNLVYINHDGKKVDELLLAGLERLGIECVEAPIAQVNADSEYITSVTLGNGRVIPATRGFIAFGGNHVKSELAVQLGVHCLDNRHIIVDPRTKMTNVSGVWAAGDVAVHSEQVTIAMGDGSQAAIWIHKKLIERKNHVSTSRIR